MDVIVQEVDPLEHFVKPLILAPLVLAVNLVSMEEYTTGLCLRVNAYALWGTKAPIVRLQKIVL